MGTKREPSPIVSIPLYTADESRNLRAELDEEREHWIDRDPAHPGEAFTLGIATYIDATDEKTREENYFGRIGPYNRLLKRRFGGLLSSLRQALQDHFKHPFSYSSKLAVPGFHIFLSPVLRRVQNLAPHFDIQYLNLARAVAAGGDGVLSFTLPIVLPKSGGGLDYWRVDTGRFQSDLETGRVRSAADYPALSPPEMFPYKVGTLVVHSGAFLHRIAGTRDIVATDERVTLQGHAFRKGGRFIMYW